MNNQEILENVKQAAFEDELQKIAGYRSEMYSMAANPVNWLIGGPAAVIGAATGGYESKKELMASNKHLASNLLIPGVGPYRAGRRIVTVMDQTAK